MPSQTLDQLGAIALPAQASDLIPILRKGSGMLASIPAGDLGAAGWTAIGPSGDQTGITDTAAIQAAITAGANLLLLAGVFWINAALLVETYASCGQTVRGSGSYYGPASVGFSTTPPPSTTVIRPVAGFSGAVFVIDGTPIGGAGQTWVQGFAIENLCIDLANLADVSTSVAIRQVQAFDCRYSRVRVINDGLNKRGWLFNTGAYATLLDTCQSNWLEAIGTSTSNGVTTLTVLNHDGNNVNLNYANNVRILGGAFQGSGTRFKARNAAWIHIETDIEGTGTAYDLDSSVNAVYLHNELQGFSGATYMASGGPSNSFVNFDQQTNFQTYPFNLTWGKINLNNQGAAGNSSFLSGAAGANYYLEVGRTGLDALLGVAAASNDFLSGTSAGDAVLASWGASTGLWLGAAQTPLVHITSTQVNVLANTGAASFGALILQPAGDTDVLTVKSHAGAVYFDVNTANQIVALPNGALLIGYSDAFATQTFDFSGATGAVKAGAAFYPGAPAASPALQTAAGLWAGSGAPSNTYGANGDYYFRSDTPGTANQRIYVKSAGSWTGIV